MLYCLICQDKENAIETRMQNREDHLKYVAETNVVKYAGPFLSEEDTMIGSLIVIDVENKDEVIEIGCILFDISFKCVLSQVSFLFPVIP